MAVSPAVGHIFLNDFVEFECVYNDVKHLCCIQKFLCQVCLHVCICNEEASNSISILHDGVFAEAQLFWSTIQLSPVLTS